MLGLFLLGRLVFPGERGRNSKPGCFSGPCWRRFRGLLFSVTLWVSVLTQEERPGVGHLLSLAGP